LGVVTATLVAKQKNALIEQTAQLTPHSAPLFFDSGTSPFLIGQQQ